MLLSVWAGQVKMSIISPKVAPPW